MNIIFATGNKHKLEEVQQIIGDRFKLFTPTDFGITDDIPENQPTIEGNASEKSEYIEKRLPQVWCFADDTGLEVEALNGEPGVYSARYAGVDKNNDANIALLLSKLHGNPNRKARFLTVISFRMNGTEHKFEGVVTGTIREERSGNDGFGYDSVFQPDGYDITFAQMDMNTKNEISHRGRATQKFLQFLQTL